MTSWGMAGGWGMLCGDRGGGLRPPPAPGLSGEQHRGDSRHGRAGSGGERGRERGAGGGRGGRRGPALHCSRAAAGKRDARPGETQAEKETGLGARAWCRGGGNRGPPPAPPGPHLPPSPLPHRMTEPAAPLGERRSAGRGKISLGKGRIWGGC